MTCKTIVGWVGLAVALAAGPAAAQGPVGPVRGVGPASGPTLSPYLNLLRNGNTPAFNYFSLVRPQFQTNAGLQSLQQQIALTGAGQAMSNGPADDLLITGRGATFMNYGGYFLSAGGGGSLRTSSLPAVGAPAAGATRLPRPGPR
jgi:hypothetical protein